MTAALCTLNGRIATACSVQIPAFGLWWAEVEAASANAADVMTGAATIVLDDVTFRGTIVSGGAVETRARYRIVGGAGGWGRTIAAKGYANDLGVKAGLVARDAALACGETIGTAPTSTVGPSFARAEAAASRVLDAIAPRAWYVDEAGLTQFGRRAAVTWPGKATRIADDSAHGRIELAPSSLAGLLPGAVVDGIEAVDVEHELDGATGKFRSTLWGRGIAATSRLPEALRRIVDAQTARHRYYAPWEYRVVQAPVGERLDLQAVRVSSGMPDLRSVRIRQGSAGVRVHPGIGSLVLVSFVDGDPSRPVVTAWDDQAGAGAVASEIALQAGTTGTTAGVTEHATSAETLMVALRETLTAIGTALGGPGAPVTALAVDATFAAGLLVSISAGSVGTATKAALLASLAAKTADTSGGSPGLGWPAVRGG